MIVTTTTFVPGSDIAEVIGLVVGAEKLGRGGTNRFEERTADAIARLTHAAETIRADAVIDVRIEPQKPAGQHGSDDNYSILCYGTAVKLVPIGT